MTNERYENFPPVLMRFRVPCYDAVDLGTPVCVDTRTVMSFQGERLLDFTTNVIETNNGRTISVLGYIRRPKQLVEK